MTAKPRKLSNSAVITSLDGTEKIAGIGTVNNSTNNVLFTVSTLFSNANTPFVSKGNNAISTANLIIRSSSTPANSSSEGIQGQIVWDSNNLYVCVANNSWIRIVGSTF